MDCPTVKPPATSGEHSTPISSVQELEGCCRDGHAGNDIDAPGLADAGRAYQRIEGLSGDGRGNGAGPERRGRPESGLWWIRVD